MERQTPDALLEEQFLWEQVNRKAVPLLCFSIAPLTVVAQKKMTEECCLLLKRSPAQSVRDERSPSYWDHHQATTHLHNEAALN